MLPLVGEEIESANSANRKIDVNLEAWREQQACQQRETAPPRMDPTVCHVRSSNGKKYSAQLWSVPFLSHLHGFYRRHVHGAMALVPFAEELADHFFHRWRARGDHQAARGQRLDQRPRQHEGVGEVDVH